MVKAADRPLSCTREQDSLRQIVPSSAKPSVSHLVSLGFRQICSRVRSRAVSWSCLNLSFLIRQKSVNILEASTPGQRDTRLLSVSSSSKQRAVRKPTDSISVVGHILLQEHDVDHCNTDWVSNTGIGKDIGYLWRWAKTVVGGYGPEGLIVLTLTYYWHKRQYIIPSLVPMVFLHLFINGH